MFWAAYGLSYFKFIFENLLCCLPLLNVSLPDKMSCKIEFFVTIVTAISSVKLSKRKSFEKRREFFVTLVTV